MVYRCLDAAPGSVAIPRQDVEKTAKPEAVAQGNTRVEAGVGDVLTKWRLGLKCDRVGSRLSPSPTPRL